MPTLDPRVDAYVERSANFAQPILRHIREVVHAACPEVVETMKWSFPHFTHHGILCSMAAFREHCALGFWRGAQVLGEEGAANGEAMGQFGRITSLDDLPPPEVLAGYVREAARLNEEGAKTPVGSGRREKGELVVPDYFLAALEGNPAARATFEGFSPSARREYVEWVSEAKGEETRRRRLETAVEWMAEGKPRNWKYLKK